VDPHNQPVFCCAILRDRAGRLVLERRPLDDHDAPGRLTCFGGRREPGESPEQCLRRELREELGFELAAFEFVLNLATPAGPAWFFEAAGPEEGTVAAIEPGYDVAWIAWDDIIVETLADWHRAALRGWRAGDRSASTD